MWETTLARNSHAGLGKYFTNISSYSPVCYVRKLAYPIRRGYFSPMLFPTWIKERMPARINERMPASIKERILARVKERMPARIKECIRSLTPNFSRMIPLHDSSPQANGQPKTT
jgi:hypothetical protein